MPHGDGEFMVIILLSLNYIIYSFTLLVQLAVTASYLQLLIVILIQTHRSLLLLVLN